MKTSPDAYGVWKPIPAVSDDKDPFAARGVGINGDGDDEPHPLAGEPHTPASTLRKSIYVALLVVFGSGMTLIISAQDRYCIHNCVGRNETFDNAGVVELCTVYANWVEAWEKNCSGETTTPEEPPTTSTLNSIWEGLFYSTNAKGGHYSDSNPLYFVTPQTSYSIYAEPAGECLAACAELDASQIRWPEDPYPTDEYKNCTANCCTPEVFHQPFVQLFQMGCGQVLTGLFFPFYRHSPEAGGTTMGDPTFRQFAPKAALASLFDALAEVFIILGLGLTAPATAEMMKATLVIFTGVMSTWFFKDFHLSWKQWAATAVMLAGAALVIAQEYIFPETCNYAGDNRGPIEEVVGALFTIIAQIFYALQFITEESLIDENKVRHLHVNKALLVFCEGWVSILAAIILQVPFTYVADPKDQWNGFTEDVATYFKEPVLWGLGIALSAAVAGFDIWGLLTAEHMGSDNRAVVCASFQVVLVWTVSLTVSYYDEFFNWVALIGFIIILAAGLAYAYTAVPKEDPRSKEKDRLLKEASS